MKKILTIGLALLTLTLTITPCIKSQHIQTTQQSSSPITTTQYNSFSQIKILYHKGIQGIEQRKITISTIKIKTLQQQIQEIQTKKSPLKTKIKQQLHLLQNHDIIPSSVSYKEIKKTFSKQKPLFKKIALQLVDHYKAQPSTADFGMNALASTLWWGDADDSIIFGIPPFTFYIPLPSLWLTAFVAGSEGCGFKSAGLLGIQSTTIDTFSNGFVFLLGFVGITIILPPGPVSGEGSLGIGFSAFIMAG